MMKNYSKQPWSQAERNLLCEKYHFSTAKELQELFPNRTYNACVKQAKYLKDRGWRLKKP